MENSRFPVFEDKDVEGLSSDMVPYWCTHIFWLDCFSLLIQQQLGEKEWMLSISLPSAFLCCKVVAPGTSSANGNDVHSPFPDLGIFFAVLVSVLIWSILGLSPGFQTF